MSADNTSNENHKNDLSNENRKEIINEDNNKNRNSPYINLVKKEIIEKRNMIKKEINNINNNDNIKKEINNDINNTIIETQNKQNIKIETPLVNNIKNEENIKNNSEYFKIEAINAINKSKLMFHQYFLFISSFQLNTLTLNDYNPINNISLSISCFIYSFLLNRYYNKKYFLVKAKTLKAFSFFFNYFLAYYLFVNGEKFYYHFINSKNK